MRSLTAARRRNADEIRQRQHFLRSAGGFFAFAYDNNGIGIGSQQIEPE
ncbi:MAG: hypothetical protein KGJ21_03760 [Pseudomonadota bacterium]|nr:hypothetical protein [Pseudomonadota bacterium]